MAAKESITSIETSTLRVEFDQTTRQWSLFRNEPEGWQALIQGASSEFFLADGRSFRTDSRQAPLKILRKKSSHLPGKGKTLTVLSSQHEVELSLSISIQEKDQSLLIDFSAKNKTKERLDCDRIEVLQISGTGGLYLAGSDWLVLLNGFQSWSETEIAELENDTYTSCWHTLFSSQERKESLLVGFATNELALNSLEFSRISRHLPLQLRAVSPLRPLSLEPHGTLRADKVLIQLVRNPGDRGKESPLENLQRYAELLHHFALGKRKFFRMGGSAAETPAGWCSYYGFYCGVSERDVIENLEAAGKEFLSEGIRYIQIDDGYQRAAGDWETNERFPHGHRWLTREIHKKGLLAGLWIAPFAVGENSELYRNHPDWLLKDPTGTPLKVGSIEHWGGTVYVLDPTHPEVRSWLTQLSRKAKREWGYDYLKLDFVYFSTLATSYHDPVSPAQAYRMGLKALEKGLAPKTFILGCGAPLGSSIGLVDGMRIGPDVDAKWNGILPPVAATSARSFYHRRIWHNDPDCVVVRKPLTLDQARAWASLVSLTGQAIMLGDDLSRLDEQRLKLLKKILPAAEENGVPVDLFEPLDGIGWSIKNPEGESFRLSRLVQFQHGDDPNWGESQFGDSSWNVVEVPDEWKNFPGLEQYRGFAWYRLHFYLPPHWKESDLVLHVGRLADADEVFFNGLRIGGTGSMPPDFVSASNQFRCYPLPATGVNWKGENVLAIRVYAAGERGGLYSVRKLKLPRLWNMKVKRRFGEWNIVGIFNWEMEPVKSEIPLSKLGLSAEESYLVYEFWEDAFLGEFRAEIGVEVPPTSSKLLAIHPAQTRPVIISTSRHLTMGTVDLEKVEWNRRKQLLSGRSVNMVPGEYTLAVWLPPGYQLAKAEPRAVYRGAAIVGSIVKVTFDLKYLKPFNWKLEFSRGPA